MGDFKVSVYGLKNLNSFEKASLVLAIFLGLALRLGFVIYSGDKESQPDEGVYHYLALSFYQHGGMGDIQPGGQWTPTAVRPPAWPWILSAIYRLLGPQRFLGRLFTAGLGVLLILIVFFLAQTLFGARSKPGLWAAWIVAFHPLLVYWSGVAMTEIPFAFICCLGLWMETLAVRSFLPSFASGMTWGIAILIRTSALPVAMALTILRMAQAFLERRWHHFLAFLLGWIILPLFWSYRNYQHFHTFALDFHGGYTALIGTMFHRENYIDTEVAAQALKRQPWHSQALGLGEAELDRFYWGKTIEFVRLYPKKFLMQSLENLLQFWRLYPRQDHPMPYHHRLLRWVSLLTEFPLSILCLMGLWWRKMEWRLWLPILFFAAILTIVHSLTVAQMRYRLPLTPLIAVFAGAAVCELRERIKQAK